MPSLKSIRKRIASVKNTQKITRAMKLMSAARLRRSQDAIIAARPYSLALARVVAELSEGAEDDAHPLLSRREDSRTEIVVFTSDRGLAGAFNSQLCRFTAAIIADELTEADEVMLRIVGRKGHDTFKRTDLNIIGRLSAPTGKTALDFSRELANQIVDDFLEDRVDRVLIVFNEFKSAISQTPTKLQMLPVEVELDDDDDGLSRGADFLFEPSRESLLQHLMPLYVQNGTYRCALESVASEFGARMSAMDSATRNAGEMIDRLSLAYNRARQAAITTELLEIIAGAESLKG